MFGLKLIRRLDLVVLASTLVLLAIGLTVLYSSGLKAAQVTSQLDTSRQFFYGIVGIGVMLFFARLDYRVLRNYSMVLYIVMVASLLAVDAFGASRLGATRWISIGFFQFQPSEFAKPMLAIVLAQHFSRHYDHINELKYWLGSLLYLVLPLGLVLAQPDLGTGMVLMAIWFAMAIAARVRWQYLAGLVASVAIMVPLIIPRLKPYQQQRIATFLDPTANPATTGYNVNQAIIAVGSGGWFGQGLGAGSQSQGNFLPSQHTDFIFAVLAEKLGFLGGLLTIGAFLVLVLRSFWISQMAPDKFGGLLAIGLTSMLLFHVFINVGMNLGIMPVTGIPLPFISAGGSSMLVSMFAIGVVQSVYIRRKKGELA